MSARRLLRGLGPRLATILLATTLTGCSAAHVHYLPGTLTTAPDAPVVAAIYLVGDAGEANPERDAVLAHVETDLERHARATPDAPALVAFLGDNIYDVGARVAFEDEDRAHLVAQVDAVRGAGRGQAVFVPGNHDWAKGAADSAAREAIRVQQAWLYEIAPDSSARLLPVDACPGPAVVPLGEDVHVVFVDTEWLLRRPADDCGTIDSFYARLEAELVRLSGQRVILAAHHPMVSGGPHGGNVAAFDHGPLVYYLGVKSGLGVQDIASPRYTQMVTRLGDAIAASGARPLAFAAGHDHSLQVIRMEGAAQPLYQLVSGSASRTSPVDRITGTRYASEAHGYMRIDFTAREAIVTVLATDDSGGLRAVFSCRLGQGEDCPEAGLAGGGS